jgi:hypothetical protein
VKIVLAYGRVRRHVRRDDLPATLAQLRAGLSDGTDAPPDATTFVEARRLGDVVMRVLPRLPVDSRCLMCSLTLISLLARRGIGGSLVIGVRPDEEFGAHAWVELGGRPILPAGGTTFARLTEL